MNTNTCLWIKIPTYINNTFTDALMSILCERSIGLEIDSSLVSLFDKLMSSLILDETDGENNHQRLQFSVLVRQPLSILKKITIDDIIKNETLFTMPLNANGFFHKKILLIDFQVSWFS